MKIFSQIRSSVFDTEEISDLILSFIHPGKEYFTKEILNKHINKQYLGNSIKTPLLKINIKNHIFDYNIEYEFADRLPLFQNYFYYINNDSTYSIIINNNIDNNNNI